MKKNWIAVLSLALNVVLVVQLVILGGKLETAERNLRNQMDGMESALQAEVYHIEQRVEQAVREATKLVLDYELQPVGIDKEAQTLEADIVLRLKEWSEDTTVELIAVVGRDTFITLLPANGLGNCIGQISVPMNQQTEVKLQAAITSGGVTTREEPGGWGDISMLLPVQMLSWGGSVPVYQFGTLIIDHYEGHLEDQNGQAIEGINTRYRLYVNEQMVREEAQCENWEYPCKLGDEIKLTLACEDEFGLGYEFLLYTGNCVENGNTQEMAGEVGMGSVSPVLTWN